MSTNSFLFDALARHQIFVMRTAGGINNDLLPILEKMSVDIEKRLSTHLTRYQQTRLQLLYKNINLIIDGAVDQWGNQLTLDLGELAEYDAEFTERLLSKASTADYILPSPSILSAVTKNVVMELQTGDDTQKLTINEMIAKFSSANKKQIKIAIQSGILEGKTSTELVRDIRRLTKKRTQSQAYAVVRTSSNAVATEARSEVYKANSDVLEGVEWVSVLDSNTTLECARRDGIIYPVDDHPPCPRHWNCRSLYVPKVKDLFSLPIKGGTRASVNGPVSSKTQYSKWINRQPAAFQDEFLGKTKGALLRRGDLKLDQFVDDKGRSYTIKELRALEPLAFEMANL